MVLLKTPQRELNHKLIRLDFEVTHLIVFLSFSNRFLVQFVQYSLSKDRKCFSVTDFLSPKNSLVLGR